MPCHIPDHLQQRQHYSEDLQEHVIYQHHTLEKKPADIAVDLNMSKHVVEHVLQMWHDTGEVVPLQSGLNKKRRRVMTPDEVEVSITCYVFFS